MCGGGFPGYGGGGLGSRLSLRAGEFNCVRNGFNPHFMILGQSSAHVNP